MIFISLIIGSISAWTVSRDGLFFIDIGLNVLKTLGFPFSSSNTKTFSRNLANMIRPSKISLALLLVSQPLKIPI
jgi:hypothetical protein